jgi:hypothetical protein
MVDGWKTGPGPPLFAGAGSGWGNLNSTAPMRGCCLIGTYVCEETVLVRIGRYGTAKHYGKHVQRL